MGKILFMDGFDHYDTAHIAEKWSGGGFVIAPGLGRSGAGFRPNGQTQISKNLAADYNELIVGYAIKWDALSVYSGPASPSICFAFTGSDYAVGVGVDAVGAVHAWRGSHNGDANTDLGASANALVAAGTFYFTEWHFNFSARTLVARLNGIQVLNLTGVGYDPGIPLVNQLCGFAGHGTGFTIDDLYVLDPTATGSAPNTFLGDIRVQFAPVAAPGRSSMFLVTPNTEPAWQAVSDNPPDDDASYAYSNTVGDVDTYKIAAVPGAENIIAAQVVALGRKDAIGSRVINLGLGNGTTEVYGGDLGLTDGYLCDTQVFELNPLTGSAFTAADLTTLELAVKVKA